MSNRITRMNHGQGFTANLVTGVVVIGASRLGLPVSTTHVSCGAMFGICSVNGCANWRVNASNNTANTIHASVMRTSGAGARSQGCCVQLCDGSNHGIPLARAAVRILPGPLMKFL